MKLRKLLQSSGLDQSSIRHDAEALEMRGPILAEVDVFDISALCHGTIQCTVIDTKVLLIEFRRKFCRQCPVKHHGSDFIERNSPRERQLLCFGKLHEIQRPRLFRNYSRWINPAGK